MEWLLPNLSVVDSKAVASCPGDDFCSDYTNLSSISYQIP